MNELTRVCLFVILLLGCFITIVGLRALISFKWIGFVHRDAMADPSQKVSEILERNYWFDFCMKPRYWNYWARRSFEGALGIRYRNNQ